MKRLRELQTTDAPLLEKAQRLIATVEPLPESRERMLRIRRELDRPRGVFAFAQRMSALALAACVVLFGASAFAAFRFVVAATRTSEAEAPARPEASSREMRRHGSVKHAVAPVEAVPKQAFAAEAAVQQPNGAAPTATVANTIAQPVRPAAVEPIAVPARRPTAVTRGAHARTHNTVRGSSYNRASAKKQDVAPPRSAGATPLQARPAPESTATNPAAPIAPALEARAQATPLNESPRSTASSSDSELVHRAVQALRRDHDPARAAALLETQRARYPRGPLAEETLSLLIEAATALGDERRHALATEYIARYPHGRYLATARRALP